MESSGGVVADGGILLFRNSKSRQKILEAQKLAPTPSNDIKADRIRQLKESYDLAILRAEELNRHPVSNLYQKVHSDRAKRVFSALSSLIYSTISFAKAKGLEDYIRQNAVSLPASLIDLNEWEYVLQNVQDCRESMIVRSTPRAEIPFDLKKKIDLCQYLAAQPIRNTKDEIQILRQTVVEQLNAFYAYLHQSMNMVLYVIEQIKDLNRKDENLSKIKNLEEQVDVLKQEVINERLTGLDKLRSAERSYELEADRLQTIIKNNSADYKCTKEEMIQSHDEEVRLLKNRIEALNRDLAQADEKIRTRDRKLASQNQTIQQLEDSITKEKTISKRLKDLQEANIVAVTSSLMSDMVMSEAININTYFKEFRDPQRVIQALNDFEEMKIDMEQLSKKHNKLMTETGELETKKNELENQVVSLQQRLKDTESTLTATQTEYASEKTRLKEEKLFLEASLSSEKQDHAKDTQEWNELEENLRRTVADLTMEVARLTSYLDGTTTENTALKAQNESLHRDNQDLRIQLLEKDNERIMALQQNMTTLVAQQEELKAQLDRSNEEKEKLLKESLEKEQEMIGALRSHIGDLSIEIVNMKGNMEEIKLTNKREAEIFASEADKVNALHDFAIDITTQVLEIKAQVDHLTHEKDIVMQLIKMGEIIRAESEPRVIALMQNIQQVESRVKDIKERMVSMNANIDTEHISESKKQQQGKLMTLSKNLDRLLWEIGALKTVVEEGVLPQELEPNAALHAIKKLEAQIVMLQSKVISSEDESRQWQEKHALITSLLSSKEAEVVKLNEQNLKHMSVIENAAVHIQELISVIEQETVNALELFNEIQLVEEELLKTQKKLESSESKALALTEQIKQQQASNAINETVLKSEHEQVVSELEEEITQWQRENDGLEEKLQEMKDYIALLASDKSEIRNTVVESGTMSGNTRRSVGFADSRNEVIVIDETVTTSSAGATVASAEIATAIEVATALVSDKNEEIENISSIEIRGDASPYNTVAPATVQESIISSDTQVKTQIAATHVEELKGKEEISVPSLSIEESSPAISTVSKEQEATSTITLSSSVSNTSPRPSDSARSVNSASSHGSKTSFGTALTARTAGHYIAQQQALNMVKEVAVHMTPSQSNLTSKQASAMSSPRISPVVVPTRTMPSSSSMGMPVDPETAVEPTTIPAIKEEEDANNVSTNGSPLLQGGSAASVSATSATSAVIMDEDIMVACPGTTQGETGWYLAQGQYFYFVRDDVSEEFMLLCGPLSPVLYNAARDECIQQLHHTSNHNEKSVLAPHLKIDRLSVQAARFQVDTLLQDIQERDEMLAHLQVVEVQNQMHQRDIGILLGKLAEYESQFGKQPKTIAQRPMPGSVLEDGVDVVSPVKLQRQDTQEALDIEFLVDDASVGASVHSEQQQKQQSLKKSMSIEDISPEIADAMQKLTSVARGFLARQRVQQLKMYRLAEETGVLVAMGNTTQGESGWYAGPNGQIFYFVLYHGQWIYAAGPIDGDEFRCLIKESTSLNRKFTMTTPPVTPHNMNKKSMKFDELSVNFSDAPPLLKKCPFSLSGIHGDLAESGEVYINVQTLRLYLSLNVEDLMVALQQNSVMGGGMMPGSAGNNTPEMGQQQMHIMYHRDQNPPKEASTLLENSQILDDDISDISSQKVSSRLPPKEDESYNIASGQDAKSTSNPEENKTLEESSIAAVSQKDEHSRSVVNGQDVENEMVDDPVNEIGLRKSLSAKFAEGSLMSSVMSINDDSVDSLEDQSLLAASVTNE